METMWLTRITQSNYGFNLRTYVLLLGELPLLPQILLTTDNERRVWLGARRAYQGASLWLRNILLGEPLSPKAYKLNAPYLYDQPFAEFLAATFRLTTAVYPRTLDLTLLNFSEPAALWFHCCWARSQISLENTGLTGRAALIGKQKHFVQLNKLYSSLKSLSFEPEIQLDSLVTAELLLLTEAQAIAKADYGFYLDHLLPYLQVLKRTSWKFKHCKYLQLYYLLPDGTLFITGKNKKLPSSLYL